MSVITEFPSATAKVRFLHVSASKARRVIDLVRGKSVEDALDILRWAPQSASEPVAKVIASAAANAQNNEGLDPRSLVVAAIYADEGPTAKRIRPRAQGRAYRIRKRTSHITVVVESRPPRGARATESARTRRAQGSKAAGTAPAVKAPATKAPAKAPSEAGAAATVEAPAKKAAAKKAPAKKTAEKAATATAAAETAEKPTAAKKAPAKKAPAKKAPAKKAPAKKASDEAKGGSE